MIKYKIFIYLFILLKIIDAANNIKARYFVKPGKYKYSDNQQKKLDLLLVKLVVNASLPLYLVDHQDCRNFINTLNSQYRLPYKKRLTNNLIPIVHNQVELKVKEQIASVETTTLSSDGWTDPRSKAYFSNSSNIITGDWNYFTFLLGCNRMRGRHTATNIFF